MSTLVIARMTSRQIVGLRRLVGLTLMALAPAAIYLLASGRQSFVASLETFIGVGISLYYSIVVPIVALVLSAAALGDERRDGTLSFLAVRPISRFGIAFGKLAGVVGTAGIITGVGSLAMGIAIGLRTTHWEYVWPMIVGGFLATAAYAAVFLPLGYLTERAVIIGLFYVFIWESAVAGTLPGLAPTSPWRIGYSAFAALVPPEALRLVPDFALGNLDPGAGGATIKVIVIAAGSVAVTGWMLRARDLS